MTTPVIAQDVFVRWPLCQIVIQLAIHRVALGVAFEDAFSTAFDDTFGLNVAGIPMADFRADHPDLILALRLVTWRTLLETNEENMSKSKRDELESRLADLRAERETFETAISDLQQQQTGLADQLVTARGQAERKPGDQDAARALSKAEQQHADLTTALERKNAALALIDDEIEITHASMTETEHEQNVRKLKRLHSEALKACDVLDHDLRDADAWNTLNQVYNQRPGLIQAVKAHDPNYTGPEIRNMIRLDVALRQYLRHVVMEIVKVSEWPLSPDLRTLISVQNGPSVAPATMSEALNLAAIPVPPRPERVL